MNLFRLESDFEDYYDCCQIDSSPLIYRRFNSERHDRSEALSFLKNNGIKTVNFGPFRNFGKNIKNFVVYTNPSLHNFLGKHIYSYNEVQSQYRNYLVSEFLDNYGGYTVKYLQIGERRFRLMFFNPDYKTKLIEGSMVAIEELPRQYNYAIGLPIYSIDYISNGVEMVAIDFNEVQRLNTIGINNLISAEDVATEVKNALIAYNKA